MPAALRVDWAAVEKLAIAGVHPTHRKLYRRNRGDAECALVGYIYDIREREFFRPEKREKRGNGFDIELALQRQTARHSGG